MTSQRPVAQLDNELRALAERTIERAFVPVQGRGPLHLPVLFAIVDELHPGWRDTDTAERTDVVRRTVTGGIRRLPDVAVPDARITWRRLAEIIFGIGPFDDATMNTVIAFEKGENKYHRLVAYARHAADFGKSGQTFSDRIRKMRRQLATELSTAARPIGLVPLPRDPGAGAYVDNPYLPTLMAALATAEPRIVSIAGEPGIGKSRLVREACGRSVGRSGFVWLRAGDDHDLYADIAAFLHRAGRTDVDTALTGAVRQFQHALDTDSAPPIVVLDDVPAMAAVAHIVGPAPRRPVVAISHAPLGEPGSAPLRGLRPAEAHTLATSLAGGLPPWETAAVAAMTGGRPGLIHRITTLLGNATGHLDVFDIWHGLQTRPAALLELLEPTPRHRLSTFYADALQRLRRDHPLTAATVELAALHELSYTHPRIVATSLRLLHGLSGNVARAVVANTYAMLPRFGVPYPSRDPLASALIRELGGPTIDRAAELHAALDREIRRLDRSRTTDDLTNLMAGRAAVDSHRGNATAVAFSHPTGTELFDAHGTRHHLAAIGAKPGEMVAAVDARGNRIRYLHEHRFLGVSVLETAEALRAQLVRAGRGLVAPSWFVARHGAVRTTP